MTKRVRLYEPAPAIPAEILSLFGDPPVLSTEDPKAYRALLGKVAEAIKPKNIIEWMWVDDVVYLSWNIRRLRRFQALVIEEKRKSLTYSATHDQEEELAKYGSRLCRDERCPANELNTDRGSGVAFQYSIDLYEGVDKLLDSAERRRNMVLREIQFYREALAHLLEEASNKIIDAEFKEAAE